MANDEHVIGSSSSSAFSSSSSPENRTARAPSPVQGPWYLQEAAQTKAVLASGAQNSSSEARREHVSILGSIPDKSTDECDNMAWMALSWSTHPAIEAKPDTRGAPMSKRAVLRDVVTRDVRTRNNSASCGGGGLGGRAHWSSSLWCRGSNVSRRCVPMTRRSGARTGAFVEDLRAKSVLGAVLGPLFYDCRA